MWDVCSWAVVVYMYNWNERDCDAYNKIHCSLLPGHYSVFSWCDFDLSYNVYNKSRRQWALNIHFHKLGFHFLTSSQSQYRPIWHVQLLSHSNNLLIDESWFCLRWFDFKQGPVLNGNISELNHNYSVKFTKWYDTFLSKLNLRFVILCPNLHVTNNIYVNSILIHRVKLHLNDPRN